MGICIFFLIIILVLQIFSVLLTLGIIQITLICLTARVNVCFRDWDESITEDQAKKAYDKMLKIEEEFGDLFTGLPSV